MWGTEAACGTHSVCGTSGSGVACGCKATSCTQAGPFCSSTTETSVCDVDGDGCLFVTSGPTSCGDHRACTGQPGAATCSCTTDPSCPSATTTFCVGGGSESKCAADGNGCFFVAMEYFEGRTLAEILRAEHRIEPRRAARYAAEICSQLQTLHAFVSDVDELWRTGGDRVSIRAEPSQ